MMGMVVSLVFLVLIALVVLGVVVGIGVTVWVSTRGNRPPRA